MPSYPNAAGTSTVPTFPPKSLAPGELDFFWNAETPTVGSGIASDRFALQLAPWVNAAAALSVEVKFAADPGVFELDIQFADTDADVYYQTAPSAGSITSVDATYFTARVEMVPAKGNFVRLVIKSRANAVALTAKVTR